MTYWIARDSHLLLLVDSEMDGGSFSSKTTTRYKPIINTPIPAAAIEFGH